MSVKLLFIKDPSVRDKEGCSVGQHPKSRCSILKATDYPRSKDYILPHPLAVPGKSMNIKRHNFFGRIWLIWWCFFWQDWVSSLRKIALGEEANWFWSRLQEWSTTWVISHMKRHYLDQWLDFNHVTIPLSDQWWTTIGKPPFPMVASNHSIQWWWYPWKPSELFDGSKN